MVPTGLEDPHAASPTHSKVIIPAKTRPSTACIPVVDIMLPAGHLWPATIQVLASTSLTKVECILPEQPMAVDGAWSLGASCAHNAPTIPSVMTSVPPKHAGGTTMLEMLKPATMPSATKVPISFAVAPAMTAIVVDRVTIVDEQIASIIRNNAVSIVACPEDSEVARPANRKMITTTETRPISSCIPVVYIMFPPSHLRSATVQVLKMTTLPKIEGILHEQAIAVGGAIRGDTPATCQHWHPSVPAVRAMVSEKYSSMTTALKKLHSSKTPSSMNTLSGDATTPTMTTIVIDRVPIVKEEIGPVI
jgi:hypothetical protein